MSLAQIVVSANAARSLSGTGTTQGPEVGLGSAVDWVAITLAVTAATGTSPSLTATLQWSNDGTTWATGDTPDTFTAITTAGTVVKRFPIRGLMFRLNEVVTGTTPAFTYTLSVAAR